jgi:adenine/guanine phosphoribosyltransferase-like PRPP-binding protein
VARRLRLPLALVMPVRLCPVPSPLYTVLMGYKESPVDLARRRFSRLVADHLTSYLDRHGPCVVTALGGPADVVLPVPSSARPSGAPLGHIAGLGMVATETLGRPVRWRPDLLRRSVAPVGHMRPHRSAFVVADPVAVADARVVLLDDTYVSGSRAQSAAAALRRAGARSVVIVPVGRILRPDRLPAHAAYLARARRQGIGNDRCGRCVVGQEAAGMA